MPPWPLNSNITDYDDYATTTDYIPASESIMRWMVSSEGVGVAGVEGVMELGGVRTAVCRGRGVRSGSSSGAGHPGMSLGFVKI